MTPIQTIHQEGILRTAYLDHEKGLTRYSFSKISNHSIGEELVQDTFMKTWKYMLKGGKIEMMKAFLYHTLNHLIVDEYRKRKTSSLDVLLDKGFEPTDENTGRMYNMIDGRAAAELINKLPEKYRKVIRMRYMQDLSLKEMSGLTGESENTLAVQSHRGLDKLKALYIPN